MNASPIDALVVAGVAFAMMAVISLLCAVMIKGIVALLARSQRAPRPPQTIAVPVRDDRARVAAAIAAAVNEVLPRHRIIRIGPAQGQEWAREARAKQHGSHRPRR
jgi:Na+-transporting methylmalonyl-CoA/oxaloacetate decarboxylase gamma subunit